ncbi:MAG: hypothetical protein ACYTEQ_12105 [Planctomycetota bacterium]
MKKYMTILVLATAAGVLLAGPLPCRAAEEVEESIWDDDRPGPRPRRAPTRRLELTEEKIDQMISHLAEKDPEKAKELNRLREEDPERFRMELGRMMKERLRRRHREGMEARNGRWEVQRGPRRPTPAAAPARRGRRPRMGTAPRGYLEWLEKNYPEQAKELAELKGRDPELHQRKTWLAFRKHRRIYEAWRKNPELGSVLKEDFELKEQRDELLEQIGAATDEDEKERLAEELEDVISSRFEVILKRKQIEYERLLEKLEELKKEVGRSQAELENWKDSQFKRVNVNARVKELVSGVEKFKWD